MPNEVVCHSERERGIYCRGDRPVALTRSKWQFIKILIFILLFCPPVYAFTLTNWNGQEINSEEDIYQLYQEGLIEYFDYLRLLDIWENEEDEVDAAPLKKGGSLRVKFEEDPLDDEGLYIYHRLQYQLPRFGFGYLVERDQETNETEFRLKKRYIFFKNFYGIENIIAGNYTLRFGHGLVIGNSYRKNKIGELTDLSLYDKFFGITGKLKINRVILTPFYSDVCQEEIRGLNTRFNITKYFNLGGTYYQSEIDTNKVEVSGIDFFYRYGFLRFSGETARVQGKGGGRYLELSYDLKEVFSLVSFRDYDPNFYNLHSQSFAQVDDEPNDRDERGFYLESNFKFSKKFKFKTSFNQWSHPERKITDRELKGQVNYNPAPFLKLSARRRIRDEDLFKEGDKKIKDYLSGKFSPCEKFEIRGFYGKNGDKNSDNEKTIDIFWGTEIKLNTDKSIFLAKAKFNDNDINDAGDKKKEYYFYAKLKKMRQTALSFSFKTIHSSEDVFPNPEEIYKVVCDYTW
ncbi:MAG: hypothetical protein ABII25_04805 [bacterium]